MAWDTYAPENLFKAVVGQESGGRHTDTSGQLLTSSKGAEGETQVMPATQQDPGLGVEPMKDKSSEEFMRFGKDYLSAIYHKYSGDVKKTAAAYNWGIGNIDKAIEQHGDKWSEHLPEETKKYVSNIEKNYKPTTKWEDVTQKEEFKSLPPQEQEKARQQYWSQVVEPRIKDKSKLDMIKQQFDQQTAIKGDAKVKAKEPTFLGTLKEEISSIPEATKKYFTEPTDATSLFDKESLQRIGESTAIGAGVGTIIPGVGTAIGAGTGLVSGLAGEVSRSFGAPKGVTLATEVLSPNILAEGANLAKTAIGKLLLPWQAKTAAGVFTKPGAEAADVLKAKEKVFGKPEINGMYTTVNAENAQKEIGTEILSNKIPVKGGQKVSDSVRDHIYETMSTSKPFAQTKDYTELMDDVRVLNQRGFASKAEMKNLEKTLMNQMSKDPKLAATANQDIINLIQNGGLYTKEGQITKMISPEMQKVLRDRFNDYLEGSLGKFKVGETEFKPYDYLKNVEEREFVANARDSIPTILDSGFKYGSAKYKDALRNITKSEAGRTEFTNALKQHFFQFGEKATVGGRTVGLETNPERLKAEFNRLRPAIEESGVMSRAQLQQLAADIEKLPTYLQGAKRATLIKNIITRGIVGAVAGESANMITPGSSYGAF